MKRDKQDIAILVLTVLVVVLAIALVVVNVTGIKIGRAELPATETPAAPSDAVQKGDFPFSDTPEIILGSGETQDRADLSDVSVSGGSVSMALVTGSFAQRGGPDFSLYLDKDTFEMTEIDGHCYFCLHGDFSANVYLELAYIDGADAQPLAATLLDDYGILTDPQNNGTVQFGDYEAVNVQGSTVDTKLDAYIIQTSRGCITLVLCTPDGTMQSYYNSLYASMTTLALTQN